MLISLGSNGYFLTEWVGVAVMLFAYIREGLGSNLSMVTN
jgi:hypothetical protein